MSKLLLIGLKAQLKHPFNTFSHFLIPGTQNYGLMTIDLHRLYVAEPDYKAFFPVAYFLVMAVKLR